MKPHTVIFRHPGRLTQAARENLRMEAEHIFPGAKIAVLVEGMEAWLIGDDGRVYDLNNSGTLVDGQFKCLAVETFGPECNVEWKAASGGLSE